MYHLPLGSPVNSQEATLRYSSSALGPAVNSDPSGTMLDQGTAGNSRLLGSKTATGMNPSFTALHGSSGAFLAGTEKGSYPDFIQIIHKEFYHLFRLGNQTARKNQL